MLAHVSKVRPLPGRRLWLEFEDGRSGEVEALGPLNGVFAALQDADYFAQVRLDPTFRCPEWPNGADLDSAVLSSEVTGQPRVIDGKVVCTPKQTRPTAT